MLQGYFTYSECADLTISMVGACSALYFLSVPFMVRMKRYIIRKRRENWKKENNRDKKD